MRSRAPVSLVLLYSAPSGWICGIAAVFRVAVHQGLGFYCGRWTGVCRGAWGSREGDAAREGAWASVEVGRRGDCGPLAGHVCGGRDAV